MLQFAVSEEKNRWLQQKMQALDVREEDLEESFVRSSGSGGQHVNKTSTCVQIRHRPTGICVSASRERSQSLNRFLARRELLERLEASHGTPTPEMERIAYKEAYLAMDLAMKERKLGVLTEKWPSWEMWTELEGLLPYRRPKITSWE